MPRGRGRPGAFRAGWWVRGSWDRQRAVAIAVGGVVGAVLRWAVFTSVDAGRFPGPCSPSTWPGHSSWVSCWPRSGRIRGLVSPARRGRHRFLWLAHHVLDVLRRGGQPEQGRRPADRRGVHRSVLAATVAAVVAGAAALVACEHPRFRWRNSHDHGCRVRCRGDGRALARAEAGRRWNRHDGLAVGTLIVNVTGSFLLGLLSNATPTTMTVVGVGGLGAYTTFSSFARDAVALVSSAASRPPRSTS